MTDTTKVLVVVGVIAAVGIGVIVAVSKGSTTPADGVISPSTNVTNQAPASEAGAIASVINEALRTGREIAGSVIETNAQRATREAAAAEAARVAAAAEARRQEDRRWAVEDRNATRSTNGDNPSRTASANGNNT